MISYHGTGATITEFQDDICLATEDFDAAYYARAGAGYGQTEARIYTVEVADTTRLADEDDLRAAAHDLYADPAALWGWEPKAFELADDFQVRQALRAAGFDGVEYDDHTDTGRTHECVRVWTSSVLSIVDVETIELEDA